MLFSKLANLFIMPNEVGVSEIKVLQSPQDRIRLQIYKSTEQGLSTGKEMANAAYCPISLTQTPENLRELVASQQKTLLKILESAGIQAYDPLTAPFSPDQNIDYSPEEIYKQDLTRIHMARFLVGIHSNASTGFGVEWQAAVDLYKVPIILVPQGLRISRMQPQPSIILTFSNLETQADTFKDIFEICQTFQIGKGLQNNKPIILGIQGRNHYNLAEVIYTAYPELKYEHDPQKPTLITQALNPDILL